MKELSEEEALYKAAAYCSVAEHCVSEVSDKLANWGLPPEGVTRVVKRLLAEKYIDEQRYCRFFIHDKLRYNKWGRNKIAQALWQKRIAPEISAPLLEEIDLDEYRSVLRDVLGSKRKGIRARNAYELQGKLIRFALSRGFEMNEIRQCLTISDEDEWLDE